MPTGSNNIVSFPCLPSAALVWRRYAFIVADWYACSRVSGPYGRKDRLVFSTTRHKSCAHRVFFARSHATNLGLTSYHGRPKELTSVTMRIAALIVDDEPLVRLDLAQSLELAGYNTFEARDAAEAIAVLEAHPEINVVFTDIQMPGTMDGLALARYVRMRWPPTVIVVSSGRHSPAKDEMPNGAFFIGKPYEPEVLGKVLLDIRQQLT